MGNLCQNCKQVQNEKKNQVQYNPQSKESSQVRSSKFNSKTQFDQKNYQHKRTKKIFQKPQNQSSSKQTRNQVKKQHDLDQDLDKNIKMLVQQNLSVEQQYRRLTDPQNKVNNQDKKNKPNHQGVKQQDKSEKKIDEDTFYIIKSSNLQSKIRQPFLDLQIENLKQQVQNNPEEKEVNTKKLLKTKIQFKSNYN